MRSQSAAFAFEGVPTRETSRAFLEQAFRARTSTGNNLIVTVPAPVARPDALLRAFPHEASILWDPPQTDACSGLGVAKTLSPNAPAIGKFFERTDHVADAASPAPRVFGGASFAPGADHETWSRQVEDIRRKIQDGSFEKVVAARHCVVELETGAGSLDVLKRLEARFPGCTRFALWQGDAAFLGATPELLVSRRGLSVLSEALAGSTEHGDGARMMASSKEREEHQLVVQAILKALEPFCDSLRSAPEPSVRELPNVLHMQTPIEGRLRDSTHILSLVQALHPTPAVGGVPTNEAIQWIVEHEALARGWYSAPVGWTDAAGDGEFVVALRSGLLRDGKAWVYAGAGIMADSDPDAEYAETELKMQALLGALHGDSR